MYIIKSKHQSLKESTYLLNTDTLLKLLNQNIRIIEWCTYLTKQIELKILKKCKMVSVFT